MLDTELKGLLHRPGVTELDQLLILLTANGASPKPIKELKVLASEFGLRWAMKADLSSRLARSKGQAIRTRSGWELSPAAREELAVRSRSYGAAGELLAKPRGASVGKVFIGHGRAPAWRELKDFIAERLGLSWDEFNRAPVAGLSTKERLQAMLGSTTFAILIMTAEDEASDGSLHARANIVHEIGLFQGRLGFEKALVLLEHGCAEFSNLTGICQIRFSNGAIAGAFEEVRRVLEREGVHYPQS